ncbi:MAG: hypothetical protein UY24_C0015G0002 [Parcubacteria group bacterium GW2011_GWA1_48_11b]|uniref:homoserine dehydrogenase n=2 Tax=Candidatus Ryaniibacteriota TaxID=1817914 RepID=A0A1G2H741_9BACT|nr:MAG: hypothetical protein UX74_C0001G0025 [Parcubacteria group bacterium GW2011_GWA2_47_10b]KKU94411.1 MAG: hypothetical protein UY24_C0015G0002 [Parcubacteria group bacterium GW2011_GWA1_48_11b]OGZ56358.1 MAG: hypothetical protein A3J04_03555 [Candidatus Ryanbacteria bacterium RIFCSPLOWO2_02_FULL_47_14]OGZ58296.1 MAG: hypothetical protein A3G60_01160 [Candidatus Ryanbacteria bacterium RIFCSPLOWO2_12_FULL_47_9c]
MKIVLVGHGNVGKELRRVISENGLEVNLIVQKDGIYDTRGLRINEIDAFPLYIDKQTFVFIAIPSNGDGEEAGVYYSESLKRGANVITCEKAFLAHNWSVVKKHRKNIKYSATVGGDSGILPAVSAFKGEIKNIRTVINGTLNYLSERVLEGIQESVLYKELLNNYFTEPGAKNLNEVIENELNDVRYKSVILANHSKIFGNTVKPDDVTLQKYQKSFRCTVLIDKRTQRIQAGFMDFSDTSWFPKGVNNVLYINDEKVAEGPGAGARITAERMFKDYLSFY